MKKLFILFFCLAILLNACASADVDETAQVTEAPAEEATPPSVSLRFSAWGNTEQQAALANIVAAFREKYPNIKVTEEYDSYDGYWEKKTTQVAGKQLPDVFAIASDYVCEYAGAGLLANLDDALVSGSPTAELLAGLPERTLANLKVDGKQVGFPFAGGALLLYYNKDMFDKAGLDYPTSGWTFKEVVEAGAKLSIDTNQDGELDQWGYLPFYLTIEDFDAIMHRFGARWFSEDGKTALSDSPEAMKAVKFIQDIIWTHKISPRPQDIEGIESPFAAGMVAMYEDGTWFLSDALNITDFEWDVTSIPLGFEGQQGGGSLIGNPNMAVSSTTPHLKEAMLLAAFMASPEGQAILGEAKGRMPVQPDGLKTWSSTPPENIGIIKEILSTKPSIVEPFCVNHYTDIYDLQYRTLEGEIATNNTPAEALMPTFTKDIQALIDTP
jgi:multiple sugar transport system substrate-binding protein